MVGNSTPLAYANISFNGFLITDCGISSINHPSLGIYELTLDNGFIGQPIVNATINFGGVSNQSLIMTYYADPATSTVTKDIGRIDPHSRRLSTSPFPLFTEVE